MIYIKMMSGEDKPDSNTSKGFELICVDSLAFVTFARVGGDAPVDMDYCGKKITIGPGNPAIEIYVGDKVETYYPAGNTYVMNESGKTIASFAHYAYDEV